jgi:hypothetical protein
LYVNQSGTVKNKIRQLQEQLEKRRRELEDSWNPLGNNILQWFSWLMPILMPVSLALIFLSFFPCIIRTVQRFLLDHMSAIANQMFNPSVPPGISTSPKPPGKTTVKAPTRMPQEPEDPAPYNTPCQQEAAKRPVLHPNYRSSAPVFIIIKRKWGNDRIIMLPFYKVVAILSSGLISWKMEPFPVIALPFNKNSRAPRQVPPLSETPVHAPTSYPPFSINGHAWPRVAPCAIFLWSVRRLVPAIKLCSWT